MGRSRARHVLATYAADELSSAFQLGALANASFGHLLGRSGRRNASEQHKTRNMTQPSIFSMFSRGGSNSRPSHVIMMG